MQNSKSRLFYIDNAKVIACFSVVIYHFVSSLIESSLIEKNLINDSFLLWLNSFQVIIFFFCSGFLFNKYGKNDTLSSWRTNTLKKGLNLLVPYLIFSFFTIILKKFGNNYVNNNVENPLYSFFISPIAPYWFLITLFIFFLIPIQNDNELNLLNILISIIFVLFYGFNSFFSIINLPSIISFLISNYIWFILGWFFSKYNLVKKIELNRISYFILLIFFSMLLILFYLKFELFTICFLKPILGFCIALCILMIFYHYFNSRSWWLSKYYFYVFLLHTIFAAGFRIVLFKFGVFNLYIHLFGLVISTCGPLFTGIICKRIIYLDIIFYPTTTIHVIRKRREKNNEINI